MAVRDAVRVQDRETILNDIRRRGVQAFWAAQARVPSWLHGCLWVVGGALRVDHPKDLDIIVDTELPIAHLGLGGAAGTTGLQGLRFPGSGESGSPSVEMRIPANPPAPSGMSFSDLLFESLLLPQRLTPVAGRTGYAEVSLGSGYSEVTVAPVRQVAAVPDRRVEPAGSAVTSPGTELSIDLWRMRDRGTLQDYLRTVPLNIQSVAYCPRTDEIQEAGYLQCVLTRTLDLTDDRLVLIDAAQFRDKVKRIQQETGYRLSDRLREYLNEPPEEDLSDDPYAHELSLG